MKNIIKNDNKLFFDVYMIQIKKIDQCVTNMKECSHDFFLMKHFYDDITKILELIKNTPKSKNINPAFYNHCLRIISLFEINIRNIYEGQIDITETNSIIKKFDKEYKIFKNDVSKILKSNEYKLVNNYKLDRKKAITREELEYIYTNNPSLYYEMIGLLKKMERERHHDDSR